MRWLNQIALAIPESVELEFKLAGIGNRAYAFAIDFLAWLVSIFIFLTLWSTAYNRIEELVRWLGGDPERAGQWVFAIGLLIVFGLYVGYFVLFETIWQGQTPGKRIARIRVICDDGRPAGLFQATLRALLRPVDDLFFTGSIGFFLIWLTKREKRLGDWLAGTLVIQVEQPQRNQTLACSTEAQAIAHALATRVNVETLPAQYFARLRQYLQRRSFLERRPRAEVSLYLARRIKAVLRLDALRLSPLPDSEPSRRQSSRRQDPEDLTPQSQASASAFPTDLTPDTFLEAVYLAYQATAVSPNITTPEV